MHRRLLLLTRDTRLPLILTILAGLTAGWLTIGQSYVLSSTVTRVFLGRQSLSQIWPWMQALLVIAIGRAVLVWVNEIAANRVAVRIKTDLRERLFTHILELGPAYTRGERTGELTAAAVDGIEALDAYFSQYLPQLVVSTLVPVSILLLVFPLDPLSGIVLLLTAPLIPFFMYMIGRGAEVVTKRQYETLSTLSAHFLDSLQGLMTLKLFGQSKAQARNIAAVSNQYRDTTLKVLQVTFLSAFALELLATISTAIIAVEVGLRLLYGQMQFQEALFLLILAPEFYLPLRMLGLRFHAGMAGTTAARRIFQILDIPAPATVTSAEAELPVADNGRNLSLELCNLTYVYPDEEKPALEGISLQIQAGQHVALVGASGAGKTTLANILLRFMTPTSGSLTMNTWPAAEVPITQWRDQMAWVPQDPHLFHTSIASNIRLGKPSASNEEVAAAARAAYLDELIASLPEKYETVVGEAGARLSSGQAQRIALARAFLRDAPILIMDEPTSSLDPETEVLLEQSTSRLMQGRTVITIAHRLNTVARADKIVVLQEGRIAEVGSHSELLQRNGVYAKIFGARVIERQPSDPASGRSNQPQEQLARVIQQPAIVEQQAKEPTRARHDSVLLRLLSFLNGSWGWVALSVLLGSITVGASVALMGTSSWLISMAALHPSIAVLEVAIVGVRFFGIARAVFRYLERLVSHNVTFRLLGRLRVWFYEKLEPLAPARLMEYQAGDLLARIIGDVNTLENFYVRVISPPLTAVLVCAGTALFLAFSDPRLALLLIACFVALGILLPVVVQYLTRRSGPEAVTRRADLEVQLVDGIQGLADLLAFGQGHERIQRIEGTGRTYGEQQQRLAVVNGGQAATHTFVTNFALWLVIWVVTPQVGAGAIPGVMLASLILITAASFEAVAPLPQAAQVWSSTREAARRLFEVVDAEPAVSEQCQPRAEAGPFASGPLLEFSGVSFAYPGQIRPAVQDIDFCVEPGQKVAIVGPSGAGKSTVASLLLRFWEYDRGKISLGDRSVREYTPDEIREKIAYISPNTYLFNTSIYENLRMARRHVSQGEVEQAAQAAQIHEQIVRLSKGYDTLIGEQGLRLSGGERQRLAIARAILKDAPILVLDEPTANLDALTEAQVLSALFQLMERKGALLITHRLVGLEQMDQILVLEHGQIVERGRHTELLERDGSYCRFWHLQNQFLTEA